MTYKSGYKDCLDDTLALLQTYDSSLFENAEKLRGKIYKDIFEMLPKYEPDKLGVVDGKNWLSTKTMPLKKKVVIKTAHGHIRIAKGRFMRGDGKVYCGSCDRPNQGDLVAVAWQPYDQQPHPTAHSRTHQEVSKIYQQGENR